MDIYQRKSRSMTQVKSFTEINAEQKCNEFLKKIGDDVIAVFPQYSALLGRLVYTVHYTVTQ